MPGAFGLRRQPSEPPLIPVKKVLAMDNFAPKTPIFTGNPRYAVTARHWQGNGPLLAGWLAGQIAAEGVAGALAIGRDVQVALLPTL